MPPEDCRDKIEHDCVDLWSKATIRKYLPSEVKDPKKRQTGNGWRREDTWNAAERIQRRSVEMVNIM
jgi:hypothetical protein